MSENKTTMLEQVQAKLKESRRKSAMGKVTELVTELEKARDAVKGIEDKIVEELSEFENEEDVRAILTATQE